MNELGEKFRRDEMSPSSAEVFSRFLLQEVVKRSKGSCLTKNSLLHFQHLSQAEPSLIFSSPFRTKANATTRAREGEWKPTRSLSKFEIESALFQPLSSLDQVQTWALSPTHNFDFVTPQKPLVTM